MKTAGCLLLLVAVLALWTAEVSSTLGDDHGGNKCDPRGCVRDEECGRFKKCSRKTGCRTGECIPREDDHGGNKCDPRGCVSDEECGRFKKCSRKTGCRTGECIPREGGHNHPGMECPNQCGPRRPCHGGLVCVSVPRCNGRACMQPVGGGGHH
ncbi:uncharacterized protein LOC144772162 [Lissotriton helveticus]